MSPVRRLPRWAAAPAAVLAGIVLAGAIGQAPASAATSIYYVGGAGCSDTGPGTQAEPFCTIGKGASVATAGQTVQVASGTYRESVSVPRSGTSGNPIEFRAAPGASVTVTGGTTGFSVSGRSFVTIRGFTITETTSYGISVSSSNNIVITDNTVRGAGRRASGQTAAGIRLTNTSASTVSDNVATNNSSHGIYLAAGTTTTVVRGNEATRNAEGFRRNATGIAVIGPNNSVIGNVLHDNEDSGMQFYPGGNNGLATLNVTYNNGDHGIDNLNVTGGRLIGNTVYRNCTSGINVEGTSGRYVVKNNISVDNAVLPAYNGISCNRRAGNIGIWDSAPSSTTVDSNLVFLSVPGKMYVFGSSFTSLAAMKAATGQEDHGIQANPNFANPAGGNLQLTEGSRAIDSADSGAPGEQSADIVGQARIDDPNVANTGIGPRSYDDRGAYEFVPGGGGGGGPPPEAPAAALTVNPGTGSAPLAVTADASGSTDPQGLTLSYTFEFGDGITVGPQPGATATHTYTTAGARTVTVTVRNTADLSDTASVPVTVGNAPPPPTGNPAYVNQIATNSSSNTKTSAYITVWRSQGVAAGHLAVITLQLTGTSETGAVTGVDDAGNTYTVARAVADGNGNRLVVLYSQLATALAPNQRITVSFPSATSYRIAGDELSGVAALDRSQAGAGSGSSFASGATAVTTDASEVVFGAVGLFGGSAPTWATGWTPLTTYSLGGNFQGRAYRIANAIGSFNATGTGSGDWLAICVTFR